MARFALITFSGGGNIPPLSGLAARLVSRGHEVHVLADAGVAGAARTASALFTEVPELAFWTPAVPRSVPQTMAQAIRLLSDRAVERHVLAELARLRPDVVLVDCLLAGCARAAHAAGHRTIVRSGRDDRRTAGTLSACVVGCRGPAHRHVRRPAGPERASGRHGLDRQRGERRRRDPPGSPSGRREPFHDGGARAAGRVPPDRARARRARRPRRRHARRSGRGRTRCSAERRASRTRAAR